MPLITSNHPLASSGDRAAPGHQVWMLGYDGCMSLDIVGPMQVFATANDVRRQQGLEHFYCVELIAKHPGYIRASCGLELVIHKGWQSLDPAWQSTILLAGGDGVERAQHDLAMHQWLQAVAPRVMRLGSVCSGALILAQAGLLQGLRATTHWCRMQELQSLGQGIDVDTDCLHTFDDQHALHRRIFTSAGVTAGIDLALALVEADLGRAMALAVARQLVLFVRRPGGQAQFSPLLLPETTQAPRLAKLLEWIPSQLGQRLGIEQLAAYACLPPRTLARVFHQELGTTPARYVEQVRVQTASALLGQHKASVTTVARLCGFGHPENLRRSFHKLLGISPSDFAQRFGQG